MGLLFFDLVALLCVSVFSGEITSPPKSVWLQKGQTAMFECVAFGGTNMWLAWKIGKRLNLPTPDETWRGEDDRHYRRSVFTVANVTSRSRGLYKCVALNAGTDLESDPARLYLGNEKPPFASHPPNRTAAEGTRVVFQCGPPLVNPPPDRVFWKKNGRRLESTKRVVIDPISNELIIKKLKPGDKGNYMCVASWSKMGETVRSRPGTLSIITKATKATLTPSKKVPIVNKRLELTCELNGDERASAVVWKYDGNTITFSKRISVTVNHKLIIRRFKLSDAGLYTCTLETESGRITASARIIAPWLRLLSGNETLKVKRGESVELQCSADGRPKPNFEWTFNGKPYGNGAVVDFIAKAGNGGRYECKAVNDVGTVKKVIKVEVKEIPLVYVFPKRLTVEHFAAVQANCSLAVPSSDAVYVWHHNGKMYNASHDNKNVQVNRNGDLIIRRATKTDNGSWHCQAFISHFSLGEAQLSLQVKSVAMKFVPGGQPPPQVSLKTGQTVYLSCNVTGERPPFRTSWYHDEKPLSELSMMNLHAQNNVLEIGPAEKTESGVYTCVVQDAQGQMMRASTRIFVYEPPHIHVYPDVVKVYQKEDAYLHCNGSGDGARIDWRMDGLDGLPRSSAGRFVVHHNGTLVIKNAKMFDANRFWCKVTSKGGQTEQPIDVKVLPLGLTDDGNNDSNGNVLLPWVPIVACCSLAYVLLMVAVMFWCKRRQYVKKETAGRKTEESAQHGPSVSSDLKITENEIEIGEKLGEGSFFVAHVGHLKKPLKENGPQTVAVKQVDGKDFQQYLTLWSLFKHKNVACLLCVCTEKIPHLIVSEYTDQGDLKAFLHEQSSLSQTTQICLMKQAADGMQYLVGQKFVHKDVAARNLLVDSNYCVKITDLCLCKEGYPEDYFVLDGLYKPLRWMSSEAIFQGKWTTQSDVWAFGVLMWEITTLGRQPFEGQSNEDAMARIGKGVMLDIPEECGAELCCIIKRCWKKEVAERPDFAALASSLDGLSSLA